MSDAQDVIKLIKDQNQVFEGELKQAITKVGNEYKEEVEKIDQKLNDMADSQLKLEKSIKSQTITAGMSDDEHKRKQCSEFVKGLRDIASGSLQQFKTDEFKSTIERKDYNSGDDQSGGVFVMPFLDAEIGKLIREFSAVRELASVATISTDKSLSITTSILSHPIFPNFLAMTLRAFSTCYFTSFSIVFHE